MMDFVFVTACDTTFFHGLMNLIDSVQQNFPEHKIIVYDLGLLDSMISTVSAKTTQNVITF